MVHAVHPVGGGRRQIVQERHCRGHVLAGHGEGWAWWRLAVDGGGNGPSPSLGLGEVDGCGSLHPELGLVLV
jgi:hypothetical protein